MRGRSTQFVRNPYIATAFTTLCVRVCVCIDAIGKVKPGETLKVIVHAVMVERQKIEHEEASWGERWRGADRQTEGQMEMRNQRQVFDFQIAARGPTRWGSLETYFA